MATIENLMDILSREVAAVEAVLAALEAERQALEGRDADALVAAANRKAEVVATAARLEQERRDLLGNRPELAGADPGVDASFRTLKDLARRCRDLNEANGALIRGQRRRVEGSLRVLQGVTPGADGGGDTYGRDGTTSLGQRGRGRLASW